MTHGQFIAPLIVDVYGLYIDADGDCTTEPGFSWSDPDIVPLASSDPNYEVDIDDGTADNDAPQSKSEYKGRIRMRKVRAIQLRNMIKDWNQIHQQWTNNQREQAIAAMWAYWLSHQLGW